MLDLAGPRQFTDIEDEQLDEIVRSIQGSFPNCGEKSLEGHLESTKNINLLKED